MLDGYLEVFRETLDHGNLSLLGVSCCMMGFGEPGMYIYVTISFRRSYEQLFVGLSHV